MDRPTVNIHFEVWDMHPGRGKHRHVVESFDCGCVEEDGRFPSAGKIYRSLQLKYNGHEFMRLSNRYMVSYSKK